MYSNFLFDLDGTLVVSRDVHTKIFDELFKSFGFAFDRDRIKMQMGKSVTDIFKHFEISPSLYSEMTVWLLKYYKSDMTELIKEHVCLVDGVRESLEYLKKSKCKCIVVTNSFENLAIQMLQVLGVSDYFEKISGTLPGDFDKIARCNKIIEDYDFTVSDCIYVGDAESDAKLAKGCNIDCCIINGEHSWVENIDDLVITYEPKYVFSDITKITELVK